MRRAGRSRIVQAAMTTGGIVVPIREARNKTQQRIAALVDLLQENPAQAFAYSDLMVETGMAYDTLLYCLHTLAEVGMVTKVETPDGPGRPKVTFQWADARGLGPRAASSR